MPSLEAYARDNEAEILDGYKGKTARFDGGNVTFKAGRTSVVVKNEAEACAELRNRGLNQCIQVKTTVSKSKVKGFVDDTFEHIKIVQAPSSVTIEPHKVQ